MAVTMAEITKLRKMTGAGMMDCKNALTEAQGDFDQAIKIIREKGQAVAAKRSDRDASEGCVLVKSVDGFGAIIALKCETDFVAQNADFIKLTQDILDAAVANKCKTLDEVNALPLGDVTIAQAVTDRSGITGEKMELDGYLTVEGPAVETYNHQNKNFLCTLVVLNKPNAAVAHDNEQGKTREELYDVIRSMPYNIQPDRGTLESPDYLLFVKSNDGKKDAALLYCFDSHSYSKLQDVKGYDWLTFDQVNWYRHQSALCKEKNGGRTLPALAFFHIPLPEYNEATSDEDAILLGTRMEKACAPVLNSGMFTAMSYSILILNGFAGYVNKIFRPKVWGGQMDWMIRAEDMFLLALSILMVAFAVSALYNYHFIPYLIYIFIVYLVLKFIFVYHKQLSKYI